MGPWHLVGQIDKDRAIKVRDRELYDAMNLVPWLIDGQVTRPEAGWEPTLEEKRAMKKDRE